MNKEKKVTKKFRQTIKETTKELLKLMGFEDAKVSLEEKEKEAVLVQVDNVEEGVLIGNEGETLFALQMILGIMIFKRVGRWIRVYVNVGSYLEERNKRLRKIAVNTAKKAKEKGETIEIPRLNPAERRIVHIKLSQDDEVKTESVGRGFRRVLLVKPVE